ncbi:phage tail assembly chaperone [Rhodobacteraceae bacterium 2376]|uniref:Phage tail assembly chaperone n=1 Tax=Rhabdonatronobacter sediminivivens TaxID=2743469 RepID=A0A7Z0HX80_9RHOB|nr:rcc01693 family protein [Rhabdonatronobacter sediminivivens]NYS23964.1 phage tail assembly chaperone [Rhabdonatronobacter sediminivivens]
MSARPGMDWAALMRAGLRDLRLTPAQFWALTPLELAVMLGFEGGAQPLTRARLEELAARYPDTAGAQQDDGHDRV